MSEKYPDVRRMTSLPVETRYTSKEVLVRKKLKYSMEKLKQLDLVSHCPACVMPFHDDASPSSQLPINLLRLPCRGKHCDHRLCKSCIYTHYINALDQLILYGSRTNQQQQHRHHLDCPICKSRNAFYARRPTVDLELADELHRTKSFRRELIKIYQMPWKVPVGTYAHILAHIGRSPLNERTDRQSHSIRHELIKDILQELVLQVHDPSVPLTR
eukprot:scaffold2315_cov113-Cylindrotheca_fusiformis.AAC.12